MNTGKYAALFILVMVAYGICESSPWWALATITVALILTFTTKE